MKEKTRNPMALALASPKYRQRRKPSKKAYQRKPRSPERGFVVSALAA